MTCTAATCHAVSGPQQAASSTETVATLSLAAKVCETGPVAAEPAGTCSCEARLRAHLGPARSRQQGAGVGGSHAAVAAVLEPGPCARAQQRQPRQTLPLRLHLCTPSPRPLSAHPIRASPCSQARPRRPDESPWQGFRPLAQRKHTGSRSMA